MIRRRLPSRAVPASVALPGASRAVTRKPRAPPTTPTAGPGAPLGRPARKVIASVPTASATSDISAMTVGTSAKPRTHRCGNSTLRSSCVSANVDTRSASAPTARCSRSCRGSAARALRKGWLMSTFVVPNATSPDAIPSASRSKRTCTPLHPLNDSNRSRSPLAVTTGSRIASADRSR